MSRSDSKNACLAATLGLEPNATDDMERLWLQSHVGGPPMDMESLWLRYFWLQGAVSLTYNDAAYEYLGGLGHTGKIDDRWAQFWKACPITAGPLKTAAPNEPSLSDTLDKQARSRMAAMEKRKLARDNLLANQHRVYDNAGIPRGGSLEERHMAYCKAGHAPMLKIERVKIVESEYQPPEETSSVTVATYGAVATGFRETIANMVWTCRGGTITSQPNYNRVIVETDSDKDVEITLTAHATSKNKEAYGSETFNHKHRQLQPPVVTIEQVEEGNNGFRPPNKKSTATGQYKAETAHFRKLVKRYEWAAEGAEILSGQGTDSVEVETSGAGEVTFTLHLVAEDIYSTSDFTHQHPKLESFKALKRKLQEGKAA